MLFGITQLPKCESVFSMSIFGTSHPHIFKYSDILASHRDTGLSLVFYFSGRKSELPIDEANFFFFFF